jgi:hypothetical protein
MVVFASQIFLLENYWFLEFVIVGLETSPYSKHHVKHYVPILMPKVYDIPPFLWRNSDVFNCLFAFSLFHLMSADCLLPDMLSFLVSNHPIRKEFGRYLTQLLKFVCYYIINITLLMHLLHFFGELLLVKVGNCFSEVEAVIASRLELLNCDSFRPFFCGMSKPIR